MADPIDSMPGKLDEIAQRVDHLERAVAENTELTRDIKDALGGLRIFGLVAKWIGGLAVAASAVWALAYQWTHGGKLPGGSP